MSKTIDITPTWQSALAIYLMALESGTPAGKKAAIEGLQQMADVAQRYVDVCAPKPCPDNDKDKVFEIYPGTDAFLTPEKIYLTHVSVIARTPEQALARAAKLGLSSDGVTFAFNAETLRTMTAGEPAFIKEF